MHHPSAIRRPRLHLRDHCPTWGLRADVWQFLQTRTGFLAARLARLRLPSGLGPSSRLRSSSYGAASRQLRRGTSLLVSLRLVCLLLKARLSRGLPSRPPSQRCAQRHDARAASARQVVVYRAVRRRSAAHSVTMLALLRRDRWWFTEPSAVAALRTASRCSRCFGATGGGLPSRSSPRTGRRDPQASEGWWRRRESNPRPKARRR